MTQILKQAKSFKIMIMIWKNDFLKIALVESFLMISAFAQTGWRSLTRPADTY